MRGPIILAALALLGALVLHAALGGGDDVARERGREETEAAFARVEAELDTLEPDFETLARLGVKLRLREQHAAVRSRLSRLRADQLAILDGRALPDADARARLEALRELVEDADRLLVTTRDLRAKVAARLEFIRDSSPLLGEARRRRDELAAAQTTDEVLRGRISNLSRRFAELEALVQRADLMLASSYEQGRVVAGTALSELGRLIDEQKALARDLE